MERFLNASGDGPKKPPKVDNMKCYMMQPHKVGYAREKYWRFGNGLQGARVLQLATGRNHMAAIALPARANRSAPGSPQSDGKLGDVPNATGYSSSVNVMMSDIQLGAPLESRRDDNSPKKALASAVQKKCSKKK